ncbi:MAG: hypothetical protein GX417_09170 [Clostridiales bacterium]|nr:hypothetical protein [Clostridiales bacterium]
MMRSFIKRTLALATMLALITVSFSACKPRLIEEEEAREAGLALIRQAFDVGARETQDAHVEYFERAGSSVIDNTEVRPDTQTPVQIYLVTISDQMRGMDLYYAEVDAITGVAYYAVKNDWLISLQPEGQNGQTAGIDGSPNDTAADAALPGDGAEEKTDDVAMRRFQTEAALASAQGCCRRDRGCAPRASIGYFVTLADGALYRIGLSWPAPEHDETERPGRHRRGTNP